MVLAYRILCLLFNPVVGDDECPNRLGSSLRFGQGLEQSRGVPDKNNICSNTLTLWATDHHLKRAQYAAADLNELLWMVQHWLLWHLKELLWLLKPRTKMATRACELQTKVTALVVERGMYFSWKLGLLLFFWCWVLKSIQLNLLLHSEWPFRVVLLHATAIMIHLCNITTWFIKKEFLHATPFITHVCKIKSWITKKTDWDIIKYVELK